MANSRTNPYLTAQPGPQILRRTLAVLLLLFVFLVGIRGMGNGFVGLGEDLLQSFFNETANPFIGLMVGLLGTTLVQSSSVTTSMIVALVAAPANPLPIANAIPMVMGANMGTTVTNTIVALGHIGRPDEFRRAFASATCHDAFNLISVAALLPLEIATGFLERLSYRVTAIVHIGSGGKLPNPIKAATKAAFKPIQAGIEALFSGERTVAAVTILVSAAIIFGALTLLVRTLRQLAATRLQVYLSRSLDANPYIGIAIGILVTVMVQSSSITTSVLVPLAGAGIVTVEQIFPVTLGANLGTTVTAMLASMAAPAETAALAVQIAVVHFLFNLMGTTLIFPLQVTRRIPVLAAHRLAALAVRSRKVAILYIVLLFYGLPAALIAVSNGM